MMSSIRFSDKLIPNVVCVGTACSTTSPARAETENQYALRGWDEKSQKTAKGGTWLSSSRWRHSSA
jgi:hypothetical protein